MIQSLESDNLVKIQNLETEKNDVVKKLEEARVKLENAEKLQNSDNTDAVLQELQSQNSTLNSELSKIKSEYTSLKSELDNSSKSTESLKSEISTLQESKNSLTAQIDSLKVVNQENSKKL